MFTTRSFCAFAAAMALVYYYANQGSYIFALTWYYLCHKLFMHIPQLLHPVKRKLKMAPLKFSSHLIAHRGGSAEAPENTLQAMKLALKDNTSQMLEMDVRITKDKQIIVCHDGDLLRLCGDPRNVKDVEYKDLPKFLKKMPMHFSKFSKKDGDNIRFDTTFETYDRKEGDQDCFSLLEDVFKSIPKAVPISIEIKDAQSIEASMLTIELLVKYDRFETTVVGGEENYVTERLLRMDKRVCTFCSK